MRQVVDPFYGRRCDGVHTRPLARSMSTRANIRYASTSLLYKNVLYVDRL